MKPNYTHHLKLALAMLITLLPLRAQQINDSGREISDSIIDLDTFVVNGIYSKSLFESIELKRSAPLIKDVIVADDIGKLPAQNVAEALQRITGISIERDRGEGITVRVRGLGGGFQITTLNGQTMAVNENVRTSGQTGRQFRYDTLPAELVSSLEVIKSPDASLDEGAIGGIINVNTHRPLDLGITSARASVENSYATLAEKHDLRVSGMANWVSRDNSFGLLVSGAYAGRSLRQDRMTETGWSFQSDGIDSDKNGTIDTGPIFVPSGVRPTLELEERDRVSVSSALQWKPSDQFQLGLDVIFSEQKVNYDEYTLGTVNWSLSRMEDIVVQDGAVTSFSMRNAGTQISRETSGITDRNLSGLLTAEWNSDRWLATASLFHSKAHSWDSDPIRRTRLRTTSGVDHSASFSKLSGSRIPSWSFTNDYDVNDPTQTPGRRLEWREIDAEDSEMAAQIDVVHTFGDGKFRNLQFGAKFRNRSRDYYRRDLRLTQGIERVVFDASYFSDFPVDDLLSGTSGNMIRSWPAPIESRFWGDWPTAAILSAPLTNSDLQNSYEVSEDIMASYLMTSFEAPVFGSELQGNIGVRYVHTDQNTKGHATVQSETTPVDFKKSYDNLLPSANFRIETTENSQLRASFARVITRPSITDLSSRLTFNSNNDIFTARGGNPDLEPFEAWQYDMVFEWYPNKTTAVSAGVFYKDIDTFIQTQLSNFDFNGNTYLLSSKVNGSEASVVGMEFAISKVFDALPAPLDGLGVQFNYTWTDSEATYVDGNQTIKDDLEGVAKNAYNFIVFYEKNRFAARISYSWSDAIVNSVGSASMATRNRDSFGTLDGSISYRLTDHWNLFFNAINITEEPQQYYVGDKLFSDYTDYGSTYSIGINWNL